MKKAILVLTVLVALPLVLGVAFTSWAAAPGAVISIDRDAAVFKGGKKKKSAVEFDHAQHASAECVSCHHKAAQADLDAGKAKSCVADGCHGPAEKVVDGKKMVDAEDAYHQCKDCHKKEGKGPTKCKDCHP